MNKYFISLIIIFALFYTIYFSIKKPIINIISPFVKLLYIITVVLFIGFMLLKTPILSLFSIFKIFTIFIFFYIFVLSILFYSKNEKILDLSI